MWHALERDLPRGALFSLSPTRGQIADLVFPSRDKNRHKPNDPIVFFPPALASDD